MFDDLISFFTCSSKDYIHNQQAFGSELLYGRNWFLFFLAKERENQTIAGANLHPEEVVLKLLLELAARPQLQAFQSSSQLREYCTSYHT